MYEHGFLYIPGRTLCFLVYDVEALWAEGMSCGTAVLLNGKGALRCSLILSPSALPDSPMYPSVQLIWGYLKWYITPVLLSSGSLSLGLTSRVLRVFVPLKWTWMSSTLLYTLVHINEMMGPELIRALNLFLKWTVTVGKSETSPIV